MLFGISHCGMGIHGCSMKVTSASVVVVMLEGPKLKSQTLCLGCLTLLDWGVYRTEAYLVLTWKVGLEDYCLDLHDLEP